LSQILKPKKGYKKVDLIPKYIEIEIPEEWKITTLDNLTDSHNSGIFKNKEFYGSGVNIVGVSDLYRHSNIDGQIFRLVQLTNEEKQDHILEEGNLIYGESSLVRTGIGKTLVVTKKGEGTYFAWHTRRLKINRNTSPNFIYYMLDSTILRNSIVNRSTTTALTGITTKDYFATKFPFPPLPEQEKIISILSDIDKIITNTQKVIDQTIQLKKGLIQKLLTKGISHKKFKNAKWYFGKEIEIPEEWEVLELRKLCKVRQGLQIPISDRFNEFGKNRFQYITVKSIHSNEFSEYVENPSKRVICTENDILFTRTGNTGEIITNIKGVFHNNFFLVDFDKKKLIKDYLVTSLKQHKIQGMIKSLAGTTTIPDLNHGDFFRLRITVPPIFEQQKIANILSNIDSQIQLHTQYKEKLEKLKKSLVQKLLTGQVRVMA